MTDKKYKIGMCVREYYIDGDGKEQSRSLDEWKQCMLLLSSNEMDLAQDKSYFICDQLQSIGIGFAKYFTPYILESFHNHD